MSFSVAALAEMVGGKVDGDGERLINDANAIEAAGSDAITFVVDASHVSRLKDCRAAAVILNPKIAAKLNEPSAETTLPCSLLVVEDPQAAFIKILPLFRKVRPRPQRGISPHAVIDPTAILGRDCYVGPGVCIAQEVVIGDSCDLHAGVVIGPGCKVGDNVVLHPNVVLYHDVNIGHRSVIHSNAVIGADGFGYRFSNGQFEKIPQLGTVDIHVDVEIGACTTIDRAAIGATVIGAGTKLDNLVMIGHNCELGRHNVFASQVGLAGSCSTGDYVRLGGQAGVKDHVRMNTGCMVGAKAGIHKDVPAGEVWFGYMATPEAEQKRLLFSLKRVPEMRDQLKELERQVAALTSQLSQISEASSDERRRAG
jgi:UDP-3-O-[3-hydroxymyristoyl] glucosamine N-acyltransferase